MSTSIGEETTNITSLHTRVGATRGNMCSKHAGPVVRITVIDGGTGDTFSVHKDLLFQSSPYFRATANFKEGDENHIILEETDPLAFRLILHWLYDDRLDPGLQNDVHTLIRTWATLDRLLMTMYKNRIMDTLRKCYRSRSATMEDLKLAASYGFGPDRALVNYLMDQVVWNQLHDWAMHRDDFAEKYYRELSADVLAALFKKKDVLARWSSRQLGHGVSAAMKAPSREQPCLYHEYCEGEECHLEARRC